ncbi:MAG: DUF4430 domain-containing protein [Lachnospiraceae bacterium]|nr:DUF4430 domain-containing protein [Lachnospiraceae bacterium]
MNNKVMKIVLALVAVAALAVGIIALTGGFGAKADGHITVTVKDLDDKLLAEKKIGYKTGDKLTDLVQNNFKGVKLEGSGEKTMIMEIEGITTPADWSTYISILINGEYADKGIASLEFKDGDKIDFVNTKYIPQ